MSVADHNRAPAVHHATLVFERDIPAPVHEVFEAFALAKLRAEWGTPSDTATIIYDVEDFREGGVDHYRCGSKQAPNIHGTSHYLEIIKNSRIVYSETIATAGQRLSASLTTVELVSSGTITKLKSTTQLASFIGTGMIDGHKVGTTASLDKLLRYFDGRSAASQETPLK